MMPFHDHVQHDLEMLGVQRCDLLFWRWEVCGVPGEVTVAGVPDRRTETRAEVDECIARKPFLAHGARDAHYFVRTGERAGRLQISESPQCRHLVQAGDARVLAHDHARLIRRNDEYVERQRRRGDELPRSTGEIECAVRSMNEHRPAVGSHEPLNRGASSVRRQAVAALSDDHGIGLSLAIELRASLAEAEQRSVSEGERHAGRRCVEREILNDRATGGLDSNPRRVVGYRDEQITGLHACKVGRTAAAPRNPSDLFVDELTCDWQLLWLPVLQWANRESRCLRAQRQDGDLDWLAGDGDVASGAADGKSAAGDVAA